MFENKNQSEITEINISVILFFFFPPYIVQNKRKKLTSFHMPFL